MQPAAYAVGVWLITAAALAIRLYHLGREPLWFDEAYTALSVVKPFGEILTLLQGEGNAPLYYFLMHAWTALCGDSESTLRLVSALAGALVIPLIYWVGARMFGGRAGLIAAGLAAVSPLHIHYSQEVRMYALMPPLAVLVLYTLQRLLVAPNRWAFIGFVAAATAGLYVHYYFLFLLPLAGVALFAPEPRRAVPLIGGAVVLIGLGFAPWLPTFLRQSQGGVEDWVTEWWRGRPFWYAVPWSLESLGPGALYPPMASFKLLSTVYARAISLGLAGLVLVGAMVQLVERVRARSVRGEIPPDPPFSKGGKLLRVPSSQKVPPFEKGGQGGISASGDEAIAIALTLSAVLLPLAIAFVVSLLRSPIYVVARHDMIAWGAYYLLAGAVLSRLKPGVALAVIAVWVGLSLATLVPYFTTDRPQRNYADMGKVIAGALVASARPGDLVVFAAATRTMTQYYLRPAPERVRLVSYPLGTDAHLGWIDPRIRTDPAYGAEAAQQFAAAIVDEGPAPAVVWVVAPASRGTPPLLSQLERRGYQTDGARSSPLITCLRRG